MGPLKLQRPTRADCAQSDADSFTELAPEIEPKQSRASASVANGNCACAGPPAHHLIPPLVVSPLPSSGARSSPVEPDSSSGFPSLSLSLSLPVFEAVAESSSGFTWTGTTSTVPSG